VLAAIVMTAAPLFAQPAPKPAVSTGFLHDLNASVESLTTRVSESVVQVQVTGYGPVDTSPNGGDTGLVIGPQRSIGSGAIIDAEGYIITNAHVVAGAKRVQVVLHTDTAAADGSHSLAAEVGQTVDARIVGTAADVDLALLKVDVPGLRPIPLADYGAIRQGEIVFAFGSPEGLRNSVTMGVVSSVARQPDPDRPTIYIQTDAPINPGNSGGPLVNVDGELVGLNTFIITESGGSQGLGFAIPSAVVASAYPQLRKFGHLHRGMVGVNLQSITPALATGLGLSRTSGVVVSDVLPDGPADIVGVEIGDVLATVNDKPVESVPMLSLELGMAAAGDTVKFGVLRGKTPLSFEVIVTERPHPIDEVADLADPEKNAIPELGVIGVDISDDTRPLLPELRADSGVFVAARTQLASGNLVPLAAGDVIHSVNTFPVRSVDGLRVLIEQGRVKGEFVLQIERDGQLLFVICEIR
jgi:serine protease Do